MIFTLTSIYPKATASTFVTGLNYLLSATNANSDAMLKWSLGHRCKSTPGKWFMFQGDSLYKKEGISMPCAATRIRAPASLSGILAVRISNLPPNGRSQAVFCETGLETYALLRCSRRPRARTGLDSDTPGPQTQLVTQSRGFALTSVGNPRRRCRLCIGGVSRTRIGCRPGENLGGQGARRRQQVSEARSQRAHQALRKLELWRLRCSPRKGVSEFQMIELTLRFEPKAAVHRQTLTLYYCRFQLLLSTFATRPHHGKRVPGHG